MQAVTYIAEWATIVLELFGIGIIIAFAVYSTLYAVAQRLRRGAGDATFQEWRVQLGKGILLGLEFLVAADILKTVAVEISLHSVGVLAAIVLIRTFLSFTLEVEMTGRWPWQQEAKSGR